MLAHRSFSNDQINPLDALLHLFNFIITSTLLASPRDRKQAVSFFTLSRVMLGSKPAIFFLDNINWPFWAACCRWDAISLEFCKNSLFLSANLRSRFWFTPISYLRQSEHEISNHIIATIRLQRFVAKYKWKIHRREIGEAQGVINLS